jgi:hypothetical protein
MEANGLQADTVTYTTIIDGHKRVKNYARVNPAYSNIFQCWELYQDAMMFNKGGDEFIHSLMIRICTAVRKCPNSQRHMIVRRH